MLYLFMAKTLKTWKDKTNDKVFCKKPCLSIPVTQTAWSNMVMMIHDLEL